MLNKLELKDDKIKKIILGNISDYFTIQKIINKKDNEFVAKVESKLDKNIFIMKKIYKNKISPIENLPFREEFFLKVLNHENIVKYYTSFEDSEYLYIITEYVNNGDLSQILSHKSKIFKIPEKKLLDIFLDCLKVLSYIHSCGIMLRVLKPEKILINNDNKIKFTNFKYAAFSNENLAKENLKITEDEYKTAKNKFENFSYNIDDIYIAPEMKKKEYIYNNKIDIYSLGRIFSSLININKESEHNNIEYSSELNSLISKMIEEDPDKRPWAKEAYKELKSIYFKKYLNYTGIIACLEWLTSLPDFDKLLAKKSYYNTTFKVLNKNIDKLNIVIYNFQEKLNAISNKNIRIDNKVSIIQILSTLFLILKEEPKLIPPEEIDNFLIKSKVNEKCNNCSKKNSYFKNGEFIILNLEKLIKLEINDLNAAIQSLSKTVTKNQPCPYCDNENQLEKEINLYNTSKYLIILFDRGENCKNKFFINFGNDLDLDGNIIQLNNETNKYKLYGVIIRKEINKLNEHNKKVEEYIYYTRKQNENLFTRNNERKTYQLAEIKSEGDVIAVFYYLQQLNSDIFGFNTKLSTIPQNSKSSGNEINLSDINKSESEVKGSIIEFPSLTFNSQYLNENDQKGVNTNSSLANNNKNKNIQDNNSLNSKNESNNKDDNNIDNTNL